jgi:hypothetical protein
MTYCAVVGCHSSTYQLDRWKDELCELHGVQHRSWPVCNCDPPFHLLPLPTSRKDPASRSVYIANIGRADLKADCPQSVRICSLHFVDGKPTALHPYPTLNMGYENPKFNKQKGRREIVKHTVTANSRSGKAVPRSSTAVCPDAFELQPEHTMDAQELRIQELQERIACLEKELVEQRHQSDKVKPALRKILVDDKQVKFYTGLPTRKHFELLCEYIEPKLARSGYWHGSKKHRQPTLNVRKTCLSRIGSPAKTGRKRKLSFRDELLLVLIKLRLGLTNHDLADRFHISDSMVSSIVNTLIKALSKTLRPLIYYPDKISVRANLPRSFELLYPRIRCILDCTEFFIDRPRDLRLQAVTYSDYKKHNTAKVLIGISPRGCITFVSDVWGGRATDRHITINSGFLDLIDPNDQIMADKGFLIKDELMYRRAELVMPPGAKGHEQMTSQDVQKTKAIANLRIHVERAIQRLKTFRILKNQMPLNLLPLIDDIVVTCAALCNLYSHLVK